MCMTFRLSEEITYVRYSWQSNCEVTRSKITRSEVKATDGGNVKTIFGTPV